MPVVVLVDRFGCNWETYKLIPYPHLMFMVVGARGTVAVVLEVG